jgi:hypothetical protein
MEEMWEILGVDSMKDYRPDLVTETSNEGVFIGNKAGLVVRARNAKVLVVLIFDNLSSRDHTWRARILRTESSGMPEALFFKIDMDKIGQPGGADMDICDFCKVADWPRVAYVKYDGNNDLKVLLSTEFPSAADLHDRVIAFL